MNGSRPSDDPYVPIACSLHDHLEAAATLGQPVSLRYLTPEGEAETRDERIVDLPTRQGAEYLKLASGLELRLDRILEVNGVPFGPPPRR